MKLNKIITKTLLLSAMVCGHVNAADLIIKNATIFDGTGSDLIKNANVIIENGKVKAIETGKIKEKATSIQSAADKIPSGCCCPSKFQKYTGLKDIQNK